MNVLSMHLYEIVITLIVIAVLILAVWAAIFLIRRIDRGS
jgi:hypothetical protein